MDDRHVDVLLIEDSTSDAILVEQMLEEAMGDRFTLTRLSRLSDGLDRLRSGAFDVVLLDLSLPDSRGLETFVELYDQVSQVPIVVLTGSGDQMLAVQAVQEGAQDYLIKGEVNSALLARSLRYAIERKRSAEALRRERVARLRREIRALAEIVALPDTTVAARSFGAMPLKDSVPDLFDQLVEDYGRLLDVALERRVYKVEPDVAEDARALAEELGALRAGPRDVVDVHITALRERSGRSNGPKAAVYTEEGRLVTLELMGHLVSYYRNRCLSFGGFQRSPSSLMRRES
jgi:DNA-binding response OmpR family regulator